MRLQSKVTAFAVALVILVGFTDVSRAAKNKTATPATPVIDAQAAQILDRACKAMTALTSYSFLATVTLDKVYQDGSKIQTGRTMAVSVKRPNAFRIVTEGDDFQAHSVFDGKTLTVTLPDRKVYAQIDAAMDTDKLMDMLATQYGIESPLGDLLSNEPCAKMTGKAGYYVGKAKIEGTVCDHLFFQGKDVDWQIWIEEGQASLPRKILLTEKNLPMSPQFTAVLSGWKTQENAAEQFKADVPEGFVRDDGVITSAKVKK